MKAAELLKGMEAAAECAERNYPGEGYEDELQRARLVFFFLRGYFGRSNDRLTRIIDTILEPVTDEAAQ